MAHQALTEDATPAELLRRLADFTFRHHEDSLKMHALESTLVKQQYRIDVLESYLASKPGAAWGAGGGGSPPGLGAAAARVGRAAGAYRSMAGGDGDADGGEVEEQYQQQRKFLSKQLPALFLQSPLSARSTRSDKFLFVL